MSGWTERGPVFPRYPDPGVMMRPRRLLLVAGAAICSATACDLTSVVDARHLAPLARAESRWKDRPFTDYTYEIRISCFCPPEINQWTRVTVRDGAVTAAAAIDPDPNFPINTLQYWQPIDSVFANLFRAMRTSSSQTYLDAIIVDYDPVLGFPSNIEYRARSNVADGGAVYSL